MQINRAIELERVGKTVGNGKLEILGDNFEISQNVGTKFTLEWELIRKLIVHFKVGRKSC